jgi:hypothetical protein
MPSAVVRVWIAQCLCPQRHAILAASSEAEDRQAAEERCLKPLREQVTRMIGSGTINPWCGLCRAPLESWRYEVGRTRFASMQEAEPAMRQSEREQGHLRRIVGDLEDEMLSRLKDAIARQDADRGRPLTDVERLANLRRRMNEDDR